MLPDDSLQFQDFTSVPIFAFFVTEAYIYVTGPRTQTESKV